MQDVAAAAEVSRATLYRYYATREQLYADLILESWQSCVYPTIASEKPTQVWIIGAGVRRVIGDRLGTLGDRVRHVVQPAFGHKKDHNAQLAALLLKASPPKMARQRRNNQACLNLFQPSLQPKQMARRYKRSPLFASLC